VFAGAAEAKARRQRALVESIHGRPSQPRDERGRFTAGGFDGGARQPVPVAQSPERAHAELLGYLIAASQVYRGTSF
jgi:hypothetical protein